MSNYRIFYEFLEQPNPFKDLEKEKPWGQGELEGELAYIPSTDEEWKNLSKEIAATQNYLAVNVTRILPLSVEGVIQGEVVDEG